MSKPNKIPRANSRKFDHSVALELAIKGLSYQDIADKFRVHVSTVKQALSKFQHLLNDLQPGAIEAYRQRRTDLFTSVERELMCSLVDPSKLAKASLNNVAYAFQQVHTARRLEEGKSTENKSIITSMLDKAHDQLYTPVTLPVVNTQSIISVDSEVVDKMEKDEP